MVAAPCLPAFLHCGAGKSTLLRLLNRLNDPNSGQILLDGIPITELDVLDLRRRVGLVAQQPVPLTDRVADDLRLGQPTLGDHRVCELLERVGLPAGFAQRRTIELSPRPRGGQRACPG